MRRESKALSLIARDSRLITFQGRTKLAEAVHSTMEHPASAHAALQHHFENMEQQREAGTLGMWIFLVTEIMFFGGMFMAYILYRTYNAEAFAVASNQLDVRL